MGGMHESTKRLLDAARAATAGEPAGRRVVDFASLGSRLGASSAVMTNWKARGISKDGALQAEAAFGCSATWLLSGDLPPHWGRDLEARAEAPWPLVNISAEEWAELDERERGAVDLAAGLALHQIRTLGKPMPPLTGGPEIARRIREAGAQLLREQEQERLEGLQADTPSPARR